MSLPAFRDWDELEASLWGEEEKEFDILLQNYGSAAPQPSYEPDLQQREEVLRKQAQKNKEHWREELQIFKGQAWVVTKKRARQALRIIGLIFILAGMFGFVIFRQSVITTQNFNNSAAQRKIRDLQQETSQMKELIMNQTDERDIRWTAIEDMQMQDPSSKQIVDLDIPAGDKLLSGSKKSTHVLNRSSIEQAKDSLTEFFNSLT